MTTNESEAPPVEVKKRKRAASKKPKEIKVEDLYPEIFKGLTPPATIYRSRRIGDMTVKDKWGNESKGVLHLAGIGSTTPEVMFVSPCTLFEEEFVGRSGLKPEMLRGPAASVFKRNLAREGFKDADWFYTALCKYNVVKLKPNSRDLRWGHETFQDELKTLKPKIVVCLGKLVFDHLYGVKFKLSDISGGFFKIPGTDILLYPMDTIILPLLKPEYMERFVTDLRQVKRCLDETRGMPVIKVVTSHHVLANAEQVQNWVNERKQEVDSGALTNLGVDCEWNGKTFAGGQLRSAQFSWKLGHAAYVRLMGENLDYAMDQPQPVIAQILDPLLNHPRVKFVGHNFFADALWLRNHLGVKTYKRCAFDTLFAQHTINEYADLKLERLAVRYTDLGRYDQKLLLWKRKTKFDEDQENEGYGKVPDSILIPYANNDVDATLRVFPILTKKLLQQGQLGYYRNRLLPFVSDGFVEMSETGFPMHRSNMDQMREVFTRNQGVLTQDFREAVDAEASRLLGEELVKVAGNADLIFELREFRDQHYLTGGEPNEETDEFKEASELFKGLFPLADLRARLPFFLHWWSAPGFNINSTDHLRRWLFQVRGFTPLKTTKKDGVQMAWEKVLSLPPEKQAEYTPATDKQTIKLFADKDKLVSRIQEVKGVGNVVKAFLKGKDEDGKEQGLMAWIQPDERIHPNYALTETARPRCVHGDTIVPCRNGGKKISDIVTGDEVWTHKNRWRKVTALHVLPAEEMFEVTFSNGEVLKATENHRLLTQEGTWVDLKHGLVQETSKRPCDPGKSEAVVLRNTDDRRAGCRSGGSESAHGVSDTQGCGSSGVAQQVQGVEVCGVEEGCEQSVLRETWSGDAELCGRLRGRQGLSDAGGEWEATFRSSNRGCRDAWNSCGAVSGVVAGASHRRESPEQRSGQSGDHHQRRPCEDSQALQAYTAGVKITRIVPCGSSPVFDITVEEDSSYEAAGCFSHNSWSPNVLNWTKNITKPIEAAFIRVNKRLALDKFNEVRHQMPTAEMRAAVKAVATAPVSIRSFVQAPPGWCLIDMDFKTAEVVQLGYTAGDRNLVGVLNAPDTQFGRTDTKNPKKAVRIAYNELSGYPQSAWDEKLVTSPDDPKILRREDGSILHPKRDLHWELAESVMEGPREVLDERMARDGIGKVGNFSIPYGALGPLLERMIEVNTGRKPKEGIGEKMRETYATRYTVAWRFCERMEEIVEDPGWYKSTSGRIRHFFFNELVDVGGLSEYSRNGILSPLKRQARNFPIQEGVAATAQRALELFLERRQQQGLDCRMMCLLYDAMTILAPLEQARASAKLLRECMTTLNQWTNHGVTWNHEVDEAFGFRWGVKPRDDEKKVLAQYV